jgi:Carboxypeptidase regulatory-like domain
MSSQRSRLVVACISVWLGLAAALVAQQITGTLTGLVTDPTGSVVPNAKVTLKNEASGDLRVTTTNAEGYFSLASIPAGIYTVIFEASGFSKRQEAGIAINAGDKRTLPDIRLEVGTATETVNVEAGSESITPVESGEKAAVLNQEQLQNIPVVGRSAAELLRVLPGMAPANTGVSNKAAFTGEVIGINGNGDGGKQSALGNYSANGTGVGQMDIIIDGSHASDPGCNCATPVNPDVDMIQEFKVYQSNFAAEHAKGPVVVSSITKTGTSTFHGEGYFTARNYVLNANEWDLNRNGQDRPQNRNYYPGGNIGGPILIPGTNFNKNRNKAFFFGGFEYFKQDVDIGVLRSTVPTAAMRTGDFSDPAIGNLTSEYNKAVGVIPANKIDPGGKVLMNLFPAANANPTLNNGYNYVQSGVFPQNGWQAIGRVDYSFSDNTKLFVRYNVQRETQNFPIQLWWRNGGAVPYPTPVVGKNRSDSVSSSLTHVFSPSLTNEVVFGLSYINFPNSFADPQKVSRKALGYPYQGVFKSGLDQIPSVQDTNGGSSLFNPGGFDPVLFAAKWLPSVSENLSKVWNTHTLKFGFYFEYITNNQPNNANSNGNIQVSTQAVNSTGNAYADLMEGILQHYDEATKNPLHNIGYRQVEFYAQDSWKIHKRLTIDYGIRFSHLGNWFDRQGIGLAIFDPSRYDNSAAALGTNSGLFWNKKDSSIPLSGADSRFMYFTPRIGVAYDIFGTGKTILRGGWGMFRYHDPQAVTGALDVGAGQRFFSRDNVALTLAQVETLTPDAVGRTSPTVIARGDDQQPLTYSYSATVSQRLPAATWFELSYVGNKNYHQLSSGNFNALNLVPIGAMPYGANYNSTLTADSFRPYQNYGIISVLNHNLYSNYNGLQATASRQRGPVMYTFAYTYSKAMGIRGGSLGGPLGNPFDLRSNYGPMPFDRTHLFAATYVVAGPKLSRQHALVKGALGGWQLSGLTQFASGQNLQANSNINFNASTTDSTLPFNSTAYLGTPDVTLQPRLICNPTRGLGTNQYINGSCFAPPIPGANGDFVFPNLRGPSLITSDLALFKSFSFTERKRLEFRASAYNFLNHPLWTFTGGDDLTLRFNAAGQMTNSAFGITSVKSGHRIMNLVVKFFF